MELFRQPELRNITAKALIIMNKIVPRNHVKTDIPVVLKRLEEKNIDPFVRYLFEACLNSYVPRKGYYERGRTYKRIRCESGAEHANAMRLVADAILCKHYPQLDRNKVARMIDIHDLPEVRTDDMTPKELLRKSMTKEDKHKLERNGITSMLVAHPDKVGLLNLWEEYEARKTDEAWFVKYNDKLQMGLMSAIYSMQGRKFFDLLIDAKTAIFEQNRFPELKEILTEIYRAIDIKPVDLKLPEKNLYRL